MIAERYASTNPTLSTSKLSLPLPLPTLTLFPPTTRNQSPESPHHPTHSTNQWIHPLRRIFLAVSYDLRFALRYFDEPPSTSRGGDRGKGGKRIKRDIHHTVPSQEFHPSHSAHEHRSQTKSLCLETTSHLLAPPQTITINLCK